jgi:hypothetical protein
MTAKIPQDTTAQTTQVLEFLTVTGLPASSESRRIVRSHAIRDANRRKKAPPPAKNEGDGREQGRGTLKPLPQGTFTTKFRVGGKEKKKVSKDGKDGGKDGGVKRGGKENQDEDADGDVGRRLEALAKEIKELNRKNRSIPVMAGVGKFDPFDTLPVKIGERQQALIQYRKFRFLSLQILVC